MERGKEVPPGKFSGLKRKIVVWVHWQIKIFHDIWLLIREEETLGGSIHKSRTSITMAAHSLNISEQTLNDITRGQHYYPGHFKLFLHSERKRWYWRDSFLPLVLCLGSSAVWMLVLSAGWLTKTPAVKLSCCKLHGD